MQRRSPFRWVDHLPRKQGRPALRQLSGLGQLEQVVQHSLVPQALGAIQPHMGRLQAEAAKTARGL